MKKKPEKGLETMFNDLCKESEITQDVVGKRLEHLRRIEEEDSIKLQQAEAAVEEAKKKLEDEMKVYERIRQRRANRQQMEQATSVSRGSGTTKESATEVGANLPAADTMRDNENVQRIEKSTESDKANLQTTLTLKPDGFEAIRLLAQSFSQTINKAAFRKTSVEPSIFSGDVLEFTDWEVDLDAYLQAENLVGKERLRHLKRYVAGDAKKCINGHFVTNTNESYMEARATLKDRYGNKQNITRTFRKKLSEWPRIQARDGKALQEFGDFLSHINSGMKSSPELNILNDCQENEKMNEKLPD